MSSSSYVCFACIGDPYLKAEVRKDGAPQVCMNCERKRPSFDLLRLGDRIDQAIFTNFIVDDDEKGPGYAELIAEEAKLPAPVATAIRDTLSATRGFVAVKDGDRDVWSDAVLHGRSA